MCDFCNGKTPVDTTIGDHDLKVSLNEENKRIMKIRISQGSIGMTRPLLINFCPFCGKNLKEEQNND